MQTKSRKRASYQQSFRRWDHYILKVLNYRIAMLVSGVAEYEQMAKQSLEVGGI
jgi:hypothetical protein